MLNLGQWLYKKDYGLPIETRNPIAAKGQRNNTSRIPSDVKRKCYLDEVKYSLPPKNDSDNQTGAPSEGMEQDIAKQTDTSLNNGEQSHVDQTGKSQSSDEQCAVEQTGTSQNSGEQSAVEQTGTSQKSGEQSAVEQSGTSQKSGEQSRNGQPKMHKETLGIQSTSDGVTNTNCTAKRLRGSKDQFKSAVVAPGNNYY
jgi:hypothetical protein